MFRVVVCLVFVSAVLCDVYLHVPRGSNNRLREQSATRTNANRLFDSQNNNRGGYNVGDKTNKGSGNNADNQYSMKYFMSGPQYKTLSSGQGQSKLTIEWTNQHGCGGNEDTDPHKQNCDIVLQYMCQDDVEDAAGTAATKAYTMRNGINTNTNNYNQGNANENENQAKARKKNIDINRGLQESWEWYDKCNRRERNKGLFTADQNLKSNNGLGVSAAIYTRQNPNGNRRGYECPEERDYFPYWHPTPWKDIAVLAVNKSMCSYYQKKSFNVRPYDECVEYWDAGKTRRKWYSRWNNRQECVDNGGEWRLLYNYLEKVPGIIGRTNQQACESSSANGIIHKWAVPYDSPDAKTAECLVLLDAPECQEAPWSRSNHIGNSRDGKASNYDWTLPFFPSYKAQRCAFRIRYNISTDDYDPYHTDSSSNQNSAPGVQSPVQQNPYVDIGAHNVPLRLAINTAQFGRTFQDRSHIFKLRRRPNGYDTQRIYNLNVRGKRGNIVQTYPAVEYDFAPNTLDIRADDLVHIQWTGSNTHNNGNPAGDGQAGDAGEGQGGTDRTNLVQAVSLNDNFPLPYEATDMWTKSEAVWIYHERNVNKEDVAISMASSGYYMCVTANKCPEPSESAENKAALNNLLNNAPASYEGALMKFERGEYVYLCTRNNNFTNRSQKGKLVVR